MIPFIQFLVSSRPQYFGIRCQHSWSPKIVYYIVRMVDPPRKEEGLDTKTDVGTPLYFYQVQNYQPQKKE